MLPQITPKIGIRKFIRRYFDLLKTAKKPLFTGFVNVGLTVYETLRAVMKGSKKFLSLRKKIRATQQVARISFLSSQRLLTETDRE